MVGRTASFLIALLFSATVHAQVAPVSRPSAIVPAQTILAHNGMVVAQEQRSARIGIEILDRGGNAVDAAVAVGFALAVTYPRAGNIGGGGFMVIHLGKTGEDAAIDYRETAPAAATETMFLDANGEPDPKKSRDSGLSVGVPGTVAGLALAHAKYGSGKLSLAELIEPAIELARNGVEIVDDIADTLPLAQPRIARWHSSAPVFLNSDGTVLMPGQDLLQPDLAITLRAIASDGPKGFYEGPVAEKIVAAVRKAGGVMTTEDMKNYRAILREPVRGTYRGYDIVSMPPPSSGGVHLIEMLNILEGYDLAKLPRGESLHVLAEVMKRAYADRATFMGDPDSVKMPVAGLISKKYAAALRTQIGNRATPATEVRSGNPGDFEGQNTTHFSVIDSDGNAVSNTYTLNFSYGLGLVAEGTGVLLNNELDDFTSKPGTANAYGLVGYNANLAGSGHTAAVINDADHRDEGWQAVPDHGLAWRQPDHQYGAADHRECDRLSFARRSGGQCAAGASSMATGRALGGARHQPRDPRRPCETQAQSGPDTATNLGELHRDHCGRLRWRCR